MTKIVSIVLISLTVLVIGYNIISEIRPKPVVTEPTTPKKPSNAKLSIVISQEEREWYDTIWKKFGKSETGSEKHKRFWNYIQDRYPITKNGTWTAYWNTYCILKRD